MIKTKCYSQQRFRNSNGQRKGKKVGMTGLHNWVRRYKPKPKFCVKCKEKKPYDLANLSQKYKRDIIDYEWLCRSCHMKKDGRMDNLHKRKYKNKLILRIHLKEYRRKYYQFHKNNAINNSKKYYQKKKIRIKEHAQFRSIESW